MKVYASASSKSLVQSRERLQKIQDKKLRLLLDFARKNVPYYRARFAQTDLDKLKLEDFPVVTKTMMMESFESFVSDPKVNAAGVLEHLKKQDPKKPFYLDKYAVCVTSGSSGSTGRFLIDMADWGGRRAITIARMMRPLLKLSEIWSFLWGKRIGWAMLIATDGTGITFLSNKLIPKIWRIFFNLKSYSVLIPIKEVAKQIADTDPIFISAYPSALENMAYEQLAGRIKMNPRLISPISETVTPAARALIAKAFPAAEVHDHYACTEFSSLSSMCSKGQLHINMDYCIVEAVDEDNHPTPKGTKSAKVLLTNLTNRVQPIIRYVINDAVEIEDSHCDCGSQLPIIRIFGRSTDKIILQDEKGDWQTHSPSQFSTVFYYCPGVKQFQIIHSEQNVLELRFSLNEGENQTQAEVQLRELFSKYFQDHGLLSTVAFNVKYMAEIPRDQKSKKVRQLCTFAASTTDASKVEKKAA